MSFGSIGYRLSETYYFLVRARRGMGRRHSREMWNASYRTGRWRYLDSAAELAHYMVIVGYAHHFHPEPAILDVGCGHGRLFQLLRHHPRSSYVGIDIAEEAVRKARSLAESRAQFLVADFEQHTPAGPHDVIIFNESLYYAPRPVEVLTRYASALSKDGIIIVSMGYNWWQAPIWSMLSRRFQIVHATTVFNERGQQWKVRVLRPRTSTVAPPTPAPR